MDNQQIGNDVYSAIHDEYVQQTGEDPAPPSQEATNSEVSKNIRSAVENSYTDAASSAVQGVLLSFEYSELVAKSLFAQAAAQSSQASQFMSGLAGKMSDAIGSSGRNATALEGMVLNNIARADAYMRETTALYNKAAASGLAASEYRALGQKLGAAASLYGLALNAIAGDVNGAGQSGASILGGAAAGALASKFLAPMIAEGMMAAGYSAAAATVTAGAAVIGAAFVGGMIGTFLYDSGITGAIGLDWLMEKAMDNGLGAFIKGLGDFGGWLGSSLYDLLHPEQDGVPGDVRNNYQNGAKYVVRRDPLALDLDGDGIETIGADGAVLFDHDGDGVKGGTGWLSGDDGFVVLDRNGNGTIDNGGELFGADTTLSDGTQATSGFRALADLDSNQDGIIDADDAAFANLRIWRDFNQDGISQAAELFRFDDLGVLSISLTPSTTVDLDLGNGNVLDNRGAYTKSDGTQGLAGDLQLAMNHFFRDFGGTSDDVAISEAASALPNLRGSGAVRDLAEAASLSGALLGLVSSITSSTGRAEMISAVESILAEWAGTSAMQSTGEFLSTSGSFPRSVLYHGIVPSEISALGSSAVLEWERAQDADIGPIIAILEKFNGSSFVSYVNDRVSTGGSTFQWSSVTDPATGQVSQLMSVTLRPEQISFLRDAYADLKDYVYGGLVFATRLADYRAAVKFNLVDGELQPDLSEFNALLESNRQENLGEALQDALDLYRYAGTTLRGAGWDGSQLLSTWISAALLSTEGLQALTFAGIQIGNEGLVGSGEADVVWAGNGNNTVRGGSSGDLFAGNGGNDTLYGEAGRDVLLGGAGSDTLNGGVGDDRLVGGEGNDDLAGGEGSDVYQFTLGDGQDSINNYDLSSGRFDILEFSSGIDPAGVRATRLNNNLILVIDGTNDRITITNYFTSDGSGGYQLDQIRFADGTIWTVDTIKPMVQIPTTGNDNLYGYAGSDDLAGLAGNDLIYGYGGDDVLDGGLGNDSLSGGAGSDIYLFNSGDGQDTIDNYDAGSARFDVLQLGQGIDSSSVMARRSGANLVLTFSGSTDKITITNYFDQDAAGSYRLDEIRFADGSAWNVETVKALVQVPTDGVDSLYGYAGADSLSGLAGNDSIYGYGGNDILVGGAGNDALSGGTGSDIYRFNAGDGQDTIDNFDASSGRTDVIEFGLGIDPTDVSVRRSGNSLVLTFSGSSDKVTVNNYFEGDAAGNYRVDEIRFSDGTVWNVPMVKALVQVPTSGNDSLYGYEINDTLLGLAGADTILGYGGDDRLEGGAGSDSLTGGAGSDVYVFNLGDGQDTINNYDTGAVRTDAIEFGSAIEAADVVARRNGDHLVLTVSGTADSITVSNYFNQDAAGPYRLDEILFADGAVWNVTTVKELVQVPTDSADTLYGYATGDTLNGASGNDVLYGYGGDDVLVGGAGNDTLDGGAGSDIYRFGLGDGQDTINNYDVTTGRSDVLLFGAGVDPALVSARRVGNALVLGIQGTEDRVAVANYFTGDAAGGYQLNEIRFESALGTAWTVEDIKALVLAPTTGNDTLQGYAIDDTMSGGDGNDTLSGNAGNDTLRGDAGSDILNGGVGSDTLEGGEGADSLNGDAGDDLLFGGLGNDTLSGGSGSDTYVFNTGDGQDTINNNDADGGRVDVLKFGAGILPNGVLARRAGDSLVLSVVGTDDKVTVNNYFVGDGAGSYRLDEIRFADNTVWDVATVKGLVLVPTEGDDVLRGFATNDSFAGGGGNDTLYGADGDDALQGDAGNDLLYGGAGKDNLAGGAGNDGLYGEAGDDQLSGGAGNDYLDGGVGSDRYIFNIGDGRDTISNYDASAGRVDVLSFGAGISPAAVSARRQGNNLVLALAGGTDQVTVTNYFIGDAAGNYQLDGVLFSDGTAWDTAAVKALVLQSTDGADVLQGYAADDSILGGGGNDTLYGNEGNDSLRGEDGDDILYGGAGNDSLSGGSGGDTLSGEAGDDTLNGGTGNDTLIGGAGSDHLSGGLGNDQLEGGDGDDHYYFAAGDGQDTLRDSAGLSTVHLSGIPAAQVYLRREGTSLLIRYTGSASDQLRLMDFFDASTQLAQRGLVIDVGDGTPWQFDAAAVDAAALLGTALDDVIDGNALDNTIAGLAGNDTIRGGDGVDFLSGGLGDDQLYGQQGNDQLIGDEGNDLLDGGAGADALSGGSGNDIYMVDDTGDTVLEAEDGGLDIIRSSVSFTLPAEVEQLVLLGQGNIDATGNSAANTLVGNSGSNHLSGLAGDDTLSGNEGADWLYGGDGNDVLDGGDGDDVVAGDAGDDVLDGGAGADVLTGGTGDDLYHVDESADTIVEAAAEGFDVVTSTASEYALSANLERLMLVEGSQAQVGIGSADDNELFGNSNGNRLDGAGGNDLMQGGLGNDTYVVDSAGDVIVELAGEGNDTVESSIDYVLGTTLENLVLTGSADLDGIGNDGDNVLVGNAGANRLDGGLGGDDMYGGDGDDYFINDSNQDWIYEYAGEGTDTLERRYETNLVLSANVENLILATGITTGNGNELDNTLTGNSSNNTLGGWDGDDLICGLEGDDNLFGGTGVDALFGGAGADYLDGGEGIDRLEGGLGNDVYVTDDSNDLVIEAVGAGTDQVQTTASFALSANIENLFLMGSSAIDGTGNDLDNYIAGNGAANVIHGGAGIDTIVAGGGNDTLYGGAGDDKYVFDVSSGSDVIDNSDGGFDGVFFTNGVTRERLTFGRDGDDLLIFVDASATPSVRVLNHFLGGDAAIDYVQPDGGYYLTTAEINQIVAGGSSSGQFDQVITGTAAGEQLVGSAGKDLIEGLAGADTLFGMGGNDTLRGGDGNDYLSGGSGSGTGSGDDVMEGGIGNDTLRGEDGNNTLSGGAGDDQYVYGGGVDVIDNTGGGTDWLFFQNGITISQLAFARSGDDLVITVNGNANQRVTITGHFLGGDMALDYLQPATGSALNTAAINALVTTSGGDSGGGSPGTGNDADYPSVKTGTANGEQIVGTSGRDLIKGLAGDDTLFGMGADDKLDGGDGNDYLSGGNGSFSGSGTDILIGGAGDDQLVGEDGDDVLFGGAGNDTYFYAEGSGADIIDNTGGGTDWLYLDAIARTRLTYHRDGDDLIVRVDGDAGQQMRVVDHFLGGEHAIAYVQPGDGGYAMSAATIAGQLTPLATASRAVTAAMSINGAENSALVDEVAPLSDASEGYAIGALVVRAPIMAASPMDAQIPADAEAHTPPLPIRSGALPIAITPSASPTPLPGRYTTIATPSTAAELQHLVDALGSFSGGSDIGLTQDADFEAFPGGLGGAHQAWSTQHRVGIALRMLER